MVSWEDVAPGFEAVLPVDAEALKKHTHQSDLRDLRATCDLVLPCYCDSSRISTALLLTTETR